MGEPTLALVLVNYASHQLLERNLDPGLAQAGIEVVVVDNHTTAEELAALQALAGERGWHVVPSPTNVGFGDGVNLGVARARELGCDAFVALNPDAVVSIAVLQELHRAVQQDQLSLVCPRMDRSDGRHYFRGSMINYATGRLKVGWPEQSTAPAGAQSRPWLTAACLAFHVRAWDVVGGFAPGYFLYWEDVDFSRRAAESGLRLVMRPDLVAIHDEGGTQHSAQGATLSTAYYYWNTRNRLLFAARHLGRADLVRWMLRTPAESRQILLRGGRRQLLASRDGLKAAARGSRDGLGLAAGALLHGRDPKIDKGATGAQSKINRVFIAHPSPDLYGSDRVMLETVSALVGAGVHVVVALPADGPLVSLVRSRGAEVVFVGMPVLRKAVLTPRGFVDFLATVLGALPRQLGLVRRQRADLVLVNTITIPMWALVGRLLRLPVVVHVHEAESRASRLVNRVLYAPLHLAHRVIANSEFTGAVVAGAHPMLGRRIVVQHNGVPGPASAERATLHGPPRLLFVGRLSPRKGPDVAVRALASLRASGVDAHLDLLGAVFPGYEWFEAELRALVAELGLEDSVTFLGFDGDVWGHIAHSDVIVVPSVLEESFGNTAIEALLGARPLVVSDTSGLAEVTQGFAAVRRVPPGDAEAVAEAVAGLVAGFDEVSRAALEDRERAIGRHAPQVYRDGILRLLREAAIRS